MRLGEINIHLRNMSKNQRAYWSEMKRIYEEATQDGFNMSGQEFVETYAPEGKIKSSQIEEAKKLTGETLIGYEIEFDKTKQFLDNLIDDLSTTKISKRTGKARVFSNGQRVKVELGRRMQTLINQYGYQVAYDAWFSMPYEIRAKIDSAAPGDRYDGYEGALSIIDWLSETITASGYDDYDGPEE